MPVIPADFGFYLSGGADNADPAASLGGAISSTAILSNQLNNLFDDVEVSEALNGDTEYRCIYLKNNHVSDALLAAKLFIASQSPSADTGIAIAVDTAPAIADENTAPTKPALGINFVEGPTTQSNRVQGGAINPATGRMVLVANSGNTVNRVFYTDDGGISYTYASDVDQQSKALSGIAWSTAQSMFLAVASSGTGRLITGPDGVSWAASVVNDAFSMTGVVYSEALGQFLVSHTTGVLVGDGVGAWTDHAHGGIQSNTQDALAVDDQNKLVLVGGTTNQIIWCPLDDLGNFTGVALPSGSLYTSVTYSPTIGRYVAVSITGFIAYSSNGQNWTEIQPFPASSHSYRHVTWSETLQQFAATSSEGTNRIITSPDGINWTQHVVGSWDNVEWHFIGDVENSVFAIPRSTVTTYLLQPETEPVVFVTPSSVETAIDLGDITAGETVPIWIRRVVGAAAVGVANDPFVLEVRGVPA